MTFSGISLLAIEVLRFDLTWTGQSECVELLRSSGFHSAAFAVMLMLPSEFERFVVDCLDCPAFERMVS